MEQEIGVIKCFDLSNTVGIRLRNALVDSLIVSWRQVLGESMDKYIQKIMSMTSKITCEFLGKKFVLISNQTNARTIRADC